MLGKLIKSINYLVNPQWKLIINNPKNVSDQYISEQKCYQTFKTLGLQLNIYNIYKNIRLYHFERSCYFTVYTVNTGCSK